MKIINNITEKLSDELKQDLRAGSRLSIAAACFSVYAFEELKTQLLQIDALRFIFTSPTFLAEQPKQEQREFYIPRRNREKALHGSEFEIRLRNAFTQRAISKECADWIRQKAVFKSNSTDEQMPGFLTVDGDAPSAYAPISGFTRAELGCERGGNMFSMINKIEAPESKAYLTLFDQLWADRRKMKDVTEQVLERITTAYRENSPEFLYFFALYHIFSDFLTNVSADDLPNDKEKYDMVYRLDALDAYNQHLVKKIAALGVTLEGSTATNGYVYCEGIDLYKDKAPTARLGFEVKGKTGTRTVVKKVYGGDDLYDLSNGLAEYADRYRILPNGIDGRDNSVTFLNGLKIYAGQICGNEQLVSLQRRIQIRETIRTHIQRERELYPRGIKVLSLFFIDEVSKYRSYDGDDDAGRNGEYAQMFEEEYENVVGNLQREFGDDAYMEYLNKINPHRTHQGYFSIDKKKGKKARFVESKVDRKTQLSDDAEAYDLIMKDKERLLSMDEPVRFIFSHSALREGWDNPNVFQICTLKKQSDSDIRSRQEIGRGLRLCVNQQGERMDESVLGGEVQELNKLTIITDFSFGEYVKALQAGLSEVLADRPRKVEPQLFLGKDLQNANGEPVRVTKELADAIYEDLIQNGYVRRGELTDKYYTDKQNETVQVAAEVQDCAASVVRVLSSIFDGRSMLPEDANGGNVEAHLDPEKLKKKEFLALWNRINHKSVYTVSFDTQELIQNSIRELNGKLDVAQVVIRKEYGEQADRLTSKEQLQNGEGFRKTKTDQQTPETAPLGSVRYDLIGKLVEETGLTRASIAAILQGMSPLKFAMFRNNPEAFILKVGRIINNQKATMIVEHITYNRLEAAYDSDIFAAGKLRGKLNVSAMRAEKSLYDHVIYDSENERKFAGELDISEKVAVYVKLPSSFFISTPVGHYNPDWAIAFTEGSVRHIFFVAETKGNTDSLELRGVENAKIECARRHFAAISNEEVVYEVVDSFEKLMQKVI